MGKFSVNGFSLLAVGHTMTLLAKAPCLWAHIKIYAEGGENALHAHVAEDHLFFVLDGEATFCDGAGLESVVRRGEGMIVPSGSLYCFRASGDVNLVMLRIGAPANAESAGWYRDESTGEQRPTAMMARVNSEGKLAPGNAPSNQTGAIRGEPVEGRSFFL